MGFFWRTWNLPVHSWMLAHVYLPLTNRKWSKQVSSPHEPKVVKAGLVPLMSRKWSKQVSSPQPQGCVAGSSRGPCTMLPLAQERVESLPRPRRGARLSGAVGVCHHVGACGCSGRLW